MEMVIDKQMATGRLRLKRGVFDRLQVNRYKLSQIGVVSYPTVLKYVQAENVDTFSGPVLYTLLSVGLGLSDAEIADMRLGDLFDVEGES
mgnify:FL=1